MTLHGTPTESDFAAQSGQLTSIEEAMQELRQLPREYWLDLARSDQSQRWRQGLRISAEEYFLHLPELHTNLEEAAILICGEVQLRREQGETPAVDDFQKRFPEFAERILIQFQMDEFLASADGTAVNDELPSISDLKLPGYEFCECLGSGSSGVVYRARQVGLGRFVAIKVLSIAGADAKQLARQRQEAEVLAKLHHPNVVHVYEVRQHRGCLHLVMEYVAGTTLTDLAAGKLLPPDESARLMLAVADTVKSVHDAGILHRDLKPSNVLVTLTGDLKIADFGLAKLQSSDNRLTTSDCVLGTPSYMAPEQALGSAHSVGPTADIYSLGAILYELLTGRPPFMGATVLDTLSLIRTQEPVAPRHLQPQLPRDLETICLHCLHKSPTNRYASAAALADDLRRYLAGQPIYARRLNVAQRGIRWCRSNPVVASLMTAVVGLLAAAIVILITSNARIRREALAKDAALATARQAVDQMLMRVASETLSEMPMGHPLRENLLQDALTFYEGFLAQPDADTSIRESAATVLNNLGCLQRELGQWDEACQSFERSVGLLSSIVDDDPQPPALLEKLAAAQEGLAYSWQLNPSASAGKEAAAHYRQALQTYHKVQRAWPDRLQPMNLCLRRSADLAFRRDDRIEAERLWRESIETGEAYLAAHPENLDARSNLCWSYADLADAIVLPTTDRIAEAEPLLQQGLKHSALILQVNPKSGQAREVAAFLNCRLGQFYSRTGRGDEAVDLCRKAVEGIESLCSQVPWNHSFWLDATYIHDDAYRSLQIAGKSSEADALLDSMQRWVTQIAHYVRDEPAPQADLARCREQLERLRQMTADDPRLSEPQAGVDSP